ncbi:MAG: T9SS type A sorting domain-containing protein [Bacteroidia bacterium]
MKAIASFFLFLMANLLVAQNAPFVKGYKLCNNPIWSTHNFRQTSDHGFILASNHVLPSSDSAGITTYGYLIKLNANGQPVWTTKYPKIACHPIPRDANAVTTAKDGGYAVATGYYYCSGSHIGKNGILLVKTDSAGIVSWSKSFTGPGTCVANCIQSTSDNGFIIAGTTWDTITYRTFYYLIRTDSLGQALWQKTYHNPSYSNGSDVGEFNSVIQTHDGGFLVCGHGLDLCNYATVLRLDPNGDILWSKQLKVGLAEFYDVKETNEHHFIITGGSSQNALMIYKLDDFSNEIWSRYITDSLKPVNVLSSVVVEDDGYTFVGSIDTGYQKTVILHTDTSGNLSWYHTFPQTYPTVYPSIALADSGYAYNSSYYSNGSNGCSIDMAIIKTNQQGWSSCTMQTSQYVVSTPPRLDTLILFPVNENYPVNSRNISCVSISLTDTTYCQLASSTAELPSSLDLSLYPNPTNGNAYLQLPQDGMNYQITLYNELGQIVDQFGEATGTLVELSTAALANGIYVVRVTTEKGTGMCLRLVKIE